MGHRGRNRTYSVGRRSRLITAPGQVVLTVPHEWLVVHHKLVLDFPTGAAKVLEARQIAAEIGPLPDLARGTQSVLQIGVDLDFLGELGRLDFDERGRHGLHVGPVVVERDAGRPDGVLVLVRVDAGVHYTAEQVIENVAQALGVQHAVQRAHEDRLLRVKPLRLTPGRIQSPQSPTESPEPPCSASCAMIP